MAELNIEVRDGLAMGAPRHQLHPAEVFIKVWEDCEVASYHTHWVSLINLADLIVSRMAEHGRSGSYNYRLRHDENWVRTYEHPAELSRAEFTAYVADAMIAVHRAEPGRLPTNPPPEDMLELNYLLDADSFDSKMSVYGFTRKHRAGAVVLDVRLYSLFEGSHPYDSDYVPDAWQFFFAERLVDGVIAVSAERDTD